MDVTWYKQSAKLVAWFILLARKFFFFYSLANCIFFFTAKFKAVAPEVNQGRLYPIVMSDSSTASPKVEISAKKIAKKKETRTDFIVVSRVRGLVKELSMQVSKDALEHLSTQVIGDLLKQAADRAKANNRKTIKTHDF